MEKNKIPPDDTPKYCIFCAKYFPIEMYACSAGLCWRMGVITTYDSVACHFSDGWKKRTGKARFIANDEELQKLTAEATAELRKRKENEDAQVRVR